VAHNAINGNPVGHVTRKPDWLDIERDYRAGVLSLRAIAAKDGRVSEGAIRKRARKREWSRDLTARIRSKAAELVVAATVRIPSPRYATESEAAETAIVDDHAQVLAHVEVTQRKHISRARAVVMDLFAELEAATGGGTTRLMRDSSHARRDDGAACGTAGMARNGGLTLSARATAAKSLADALRTLVNLERQAWGMDVGGPDPANDRRVLDSSKLTWEERQQLRAMILRVSDEAPSATVDQSPE